MEPEDKLAELNRITAEQDAKHEANMAKITGGDTSTKIDETDADRLLLLDRIADRVPGLDLDRHRIEWLTLEDGHEALLLDGGGMDGGDGFFIANDGGDLNVIGPTAPLLPGGIGCIVVDADGGRRLARLIRDPLAPPADDE